MTTIVLTTIGIILAAATALMIMFYGGERFNTDTAKAHAQTLMNAGANVRSASGVYYATKGELPLDPAALVAAKGLTAMPTVTGIGNPEIQWRDYGEMGGDSKKAYVVSGVRDEVCRYVNQKLISENRDQILSKPEGVTGCYAENGSNVYYIMLSDVAPENVALTSCDNPPEDDSDVAIDAKICFIKKAMTQAAVLAQGVTEDETILSNNYPYLAKGAVSYVMVKPNGGRFGSGPYITFYLKDGHWEYTRFCQRWNATQKPMGAGRCDDWYFSHIVLHL